MQTSATLLHWLVGVALLLVLGSALLYLFADASPAGTDAQYTIAATIHPVYDIARQIAVDTPVNVVRIVPPGASPHTFEATPSLVREIDDADVVFAVGHGLDTWTDDLSDTSGAPIVTVDTGITLRDLEEAHIADGEDDVHDPSDGSLDPHYWLALENAGHIADTITRELSSLYPTHAEQFSANFDTFLDSLQRLAGERAGATTALSGVQAVTLHDGWGYFADELGFSIIASIEPSPGREPSPQHVRELTELFAEHQIDIVISEPQLSEATLLAFVREHSLPIVELDPLGGVPGRETYQEMMRYNTEALVEALGAQYTEGQ